jgi:hypothetical protein
MIKYSWAQIIEMSNLWHRVCCHRDQFFVPRAPGLNRSLRIYCYEISIRNLVLILFWLINSGVGTRESQIGGRFPDKVSRVTQCVTRRRRGLRHEDVDSNQQTPVRQSPLLPICIWAMDNHTPPLSLTILGAIFLLTGAICACIITIDIIIRKGWQTMMWIM